MNPAYATEADLTAAPWGIVAGNGADLLTQASALLDDVVTAPFAVDAVTELPTDPDIAAALRDAACAQAQYWVVGPGEEHDIEGMHGRRVSIGHLSVDQLPPEVAPRAVRLLRSAGLLSPSGIDTTAARFFATQTGS